MTNQRWTRRQFSQALAASAAATALARGASALPLGRSQAFAFVGSSGSDATRGSIHVFRAEGRTWSETHAVEAAAPSHLVMHPAKPMLYVTHAVERWEQRPRGAVSAFRFDAMSGRLTHAGTQPLSLSATHPRHAVVTADGDALFVAAESGGIYNVLPIAHDGTLQPVSAIRKEFGAGDYENSKTAAPRHVVRHADGSLYTADTGQETISRFTADRNGITLQHRSRVHAGAGASQVLLSQDGFAYALNAADGSISVHRMAPDGLGAASGLAAPSHAGAGGRATMTLHPSERFLLASYDGVLQVLQAHPANGRLTLLHAAAAAPMQSLRFTADGSQLLGVTATGAVVSHTFNPRTGLLESPRTVAHADGAATLLLHTA